MKKRTDLLLIFFGGPLFGVLLEWQFPQAPGILLSVLAGVAMMAVIVVLRRVVGTRSVPRFLLVSFLAGFLMGLTLWWLIGRRHPWVFYAVPGAFFFLFAGLFEVLTSRGKVLDE